MDEAALILRCQCGESVILEDLVHLHADSLYRFCYHLCGNADGAAELFQETWVKAFLNINKCQAKDTILGWLFTIAVNLHRDYWRRCMRRRNILSRNRHKPLVHDDKVMEDEQHSLVRQALAEMDDAYRVPLILYYFEDYTVEAISALLNVPEGTVKSRLHRARKRLKSRLEVLL